MGGYDRPDRADRASAYLYAPTMNMVRSSIGLYYKIIKIGTCNFDNTYLIKKTDALAIDMNTR